MVIVSKLLFITLLSLTRHVSGINSLFLVPGIITGIGLPATYETLAYDDCSINANWLPGFISTDTCRVRTLVKPHMDKQLLRCYIWLEFVPFRS